MNTCIYIQRYKYMCVISQSLSHSPSYNTDTCSRQPRRSGVHALSSYRLESKEPSGGDDCWTLETVRQTLTSEQAHSAPDGCTCMGATPRARSQDAGSNPGYDKQFSTMVPS